MSATIIMLRRSSRRSTHPVTQPPSPHLPPITVPRAEPQNRVLAASARPQESDHREHHIQV
ncbi:MAG: hypothetical protein JOZ09_02820 [Pseudonocardiales bacterium]|nr:hypothetical protein [Pseudonocardiales bacterium]